MQHANNMAQINEIARKQREENMAEMAKMNEEHRVKMAKIEAGYYLKGDKWQNNLQLNLVINQSNQAYLQPKSDIYQNNQAYGALQSGLYTYKNYPQPYQYQNHPESNSQQNLATYQHNYSNNICENERYKSELKIIDRQREHDMNTIPQNI